MIKRVENLHKVLKTKITNDINFSFTDDEIEERQKIKKIFEVKSSSKSTTKVIMKW